MLRRCTLALAVLLAGGGCMNPEHCGGDDLARALAAALPGDVVRLGECRVDGPLTVPPGVALLGAGRRHSTVAAGTGVAVTLVPSPGAGATTVTDLTVESDGWAGVVAQGAGTAEVTRLDVRAAGVGVAAEDLDGVVLADLALEAGPAGTHGLVLSRIEAASIKRIEVSGFGEAGVLAVASGLEWEDGDVAANATSGLVVHGGEVTLSRVAIDDTRIGRGPRAFGAAFLGGTSVTSDGLQVTATAGPGVVQDGAIASHHGLVSEDNADAGLWTQGGSLALDTLGSRLAGNHAGGLVALGLDSVTLYAVEAGGTALAGGMADGVQIVGAGRATLHEVVLGDNDRIDLLIDLAGGSTDSVTLASVTAGGGGAAVQNGTALPGWNAGVSGLSWVADEPFAVAAPLAAEDLPVPTAVLAGGIDALIE